MRKIFVVIGTNGILDVVGPVGAATTEELAAIIAKRQSWKLDSFKIFPVDVAESAADTESWVA